MLDSRLIAIVRFHEEGDVDGAVAALVRGGVEVVEVTLDTPRALGVVARCAADGMTIGAGTVVRAEQVAECAEAGARFVVSPGLVPAVVDEALRLGVEPVPGVASRSTTSARTSTRVRRPSGSAASSSGAPRRGRTPTSSGSKRGPRGRSRRCAAK
jgi:2-dehydro-3-deoxyphosphogluconate aldolase/(4S)-4-hydroxy-2-oxoglutarate aldolase